MSKVFEFDDGQAQNAGTKYDTRPGRKASGWTRAEFLQSLLVYKQTQGVLKTQRLLETVCGHSDPTRVPAYAFGVVMGLMTQGLTDRREMRYAADYYTRPATLRLSDNRHPRPKDSA